MNKQIIEILNLKDNELVALSKKNVLSLSLNEMIVIQEYFRSLGRNPTDVELETMAQTWSEHCNHKTLTGTVEYKENINGKKRTVVYNNLLKETVFKATQELNKEWCWSVFKDNAGIIKFDDNFGVAFKVETHNHPSALEPYGGAATGIGGVIRDILGVGLGAKPLANTDIFCFGEPETPRAKVPKGVLHPKRIMKGVVSGVRDYGNRMGIPTVNGGVHFDYGYTMNPLVFCGTMGMIPKDKCSKEVKPGDLVLVVGGRTGRDGIHGATFSSIKLDEDSDVTAVQIGNPIVEKKVADTLLEARDLNLYRGLTDCGAGGLSSAVGELGEACGVRVELDKVPLKYAGLKPWEIWVSEAQERMVLAVQPENKEKIIQIFASENVEATFIGTFTDNKKLHLLYNGETVAELDMDFLHKGVPKLTKPAVWNKKTVTGTKSRSVNSKTLGKDLNNILSSLAVCSREWIIRQYDHEVQGQTVIKPLQGNDIFVSGPGDASVIWPFTIVKDTYKGVVLSNGLNIEYGKIDPYWMAASAIDEALRNAVCVGADINRIAILDNFCWGNPDKKEVLGSLVRAAQACYDMAKVYGTPFISGKDSLHNEYSVGGKEYSIPPALLISAVGIVEDIRKTVTMPLKAEGNSIYIVGETKKELGGSQFSKLKKLKGGELPIVEPVKAKLAMEKLAKAISDERVSSCHDCSEGGIMVALSEMAFSGKLGVDIDLSSIPVNEKLTPTEILFSESNSRFIVEVSLDQEKSFEQQLAGTVLAKIGVVKGKNVVVKNGKNKLINEPIKTLDKSWRKTLDW